MIKLIVGLGNPGQQYEKTRHNVGFLFLEHLATLSGSAWNKEKRFQGMWATGKLRLQKVILFKPDTFMNCSGQAVGLIARYYKINPDEILVIHDELDFEVGKVKIKNNGGHAGHNGLRDIIAHLDSHAFYRLRIGIGRPAAGKSVADYVLSTPSKEEMEKITGAIINGERLVDNLMSEIKD